MLDTHARRYDRGSLMQIAVGTTLSLFYLFVLMQAGPYARAHQFTISRMHAHPCRVQKTCDLLP